MNNKQIIGHIMVATGENVSELAARYGYTNQAFYDAIKGRTRSAAIRKIISDTVHKPVLELWPEPAKEEE